jgi:hypothetical protein
MLLIALAMRSLRLFKASYTSSLRPHTARIAILLIALAMRSSSCTSSYKELLIHSHTSMTSMLIH